MVGQSVYVRRSALRQGLILGNPMWRFIGVLGGNPFLRPIAMLMVGQGVYVRRSAIRQGLVLGNPMWRFIGVLLLGQEMYKVALKKAPERLSVERIGPGRRVTVDVMEPNLQLNRRERRAELRRLEAEAVASVEARRRS
jgi:hypothetical protein